MTNANTRGRQHQPTNAYSRKLAERAKLIANPPKTPTMSANITSASKFEPPFRRTSNWQARVDAAQGPDMSDFER